MYICTLEELIVVSLLYKYEVIGNGNSTEQFYIKFQNLRDFHKICISGKISAFHRDTNYIFEHLFE